MKIPQDAIIPTAKLTQYLLVLRSRDDKAKFLAQAGFTLANPELLEAAIRQLLALTEAVEDSTNEYGTYYLVVGELTGTNGHPLPGITVWIQRAIDHQFQFVTLKPWKEKSI